MKRILLVLVPVFLIIMGGCKKSNLMVFDSPANVYFDFTGTQQDSLLYTFAYEPSRAADTVYIPVALSGIRTNVARKFMLKIDPDSTTAVANLDYEPLDSFYILAPGTGITQVPLIIYNKDILLQSQSVTIKFSLLPTKDLDTALSSMIRGKLVFSSKLERPDWWGMWMGDYYSQVKHQLFLIVTGQITLTTGQEGGLDAPKNLYFVSQLTAFLNDPFYWISKNPAKGYVLVANTDGSYSFYNTDNPDKKILYKYDASAGRYFFIDENGLEVN